MNKAEFLQRIFREAKYALTSGYGYRIHPITHVKTFHYGEDYGTYKVKCPLYSPIYGVVKEATYNVARGNYVTITTPFGLVRLQHLNSRSVSVGQRIVAGTLIGYAGTTGASTGVHLHLEFKTLAGGAMNPDSFVPMYKDPIIDTKKVSASALNVRTGAGATFPLANRTPNPMKKDTLVDIFEYAKDSSGKTWAKIDYVDKEYCANWYLV